VALPTSIEKIRSLLLKCRSRSNADEGEDDELEATGAFQPKPTLGAGYRSFGPTLRYPVAVTGGVVSSKSSNRDTGSNTGGNS
jgi:hypothetical protein